MMLQTKWLWALVAVLMITLIPNFSASAAPKTADTIERPAQVATFVPVCRDARGRWDRRACRRMARFDARRLALV